MVAYVGQPLRLRTRSQRVLAGSADEDVEAFLNEVVVVGEDLGDPVTALIFQYPPDCSSGQLPQGRTALRQAVQEFG